MLTKSILFAVLLISSSLTWADNNYDTISDIQMSCHKNGGSWNYMNATCTYSDGTQTAEDHNCGEGKYWSIVKAACIPNGTIQTSKGTENIPSFGVRCSEDTEKALADCNFEGNSSVQNVMGIAGQLKNTFDQMAATNPQLACSKLGQLSGAASAASGLFNGVCTTAYQKCKSSCEEDIAAAKAAGLIGTDLADLKTDLKRCNQLSDTLQKAAGNIAQFANVGQAMTFCKSETGDPWAKHCLEEPSDPYCAKLAAGGTANCADPAFAASSTVCICQKNPSDARCGNSSLASKLGSSSSSSSSTDGMANPGDFGSLDTSGMGGGVNDPGTAAAYKPQDGDLSRGGAGRGGGMGGGNGGTGASISKGNGGGPGGSGLNTKIIGGYGGGRGGAKFGGSGTGEAGGRNAYGQQVAMNNPNGTGVDLKQFLPGGQRDPSRGLAGVSGPDGITGPNTDIWKKINSRYFSVSPSLMP